LATVIRTAVNDSTGLDIQVEPRVITNPSTPVCIDVLPGTPSRDSATAGFGDISGFYVVTVRARANVADSDSTQDILVDMADDQHDLCVAAAIESDQSLNGWAYEVAVDPDGFSGLQWFPFPDGPPMVGCTWRVLVGQAES
jgi:hypothetical protein